MEEIQTHFVGKSVEIGTDRSLIKKDGFLLLVPFSKDQLL